MFNLKAFRTDHNISQSEICYVLDIAQPYVSAIESGKRPLNRQKFELLYKRYGDKILPYKENEVVILTPSEDQGNKSIHGNYCEVPVFPLSAQGGSIKSFKVELEKANVEYLVTPTKEGEVALTVTGDDMSPEYPAGTRVILKKIDENAFIHWGKAFVVDTVNGVILKRLMPAQDPEKIRCESINPSYPPFDVSRCDINGVYRVLLSLSVK
jgi:phage repressor protein C with HTH and peptisase S24 domain